MSAQRLLIVLLLATAAMVPAQDGLYAPSVPEDAALVRVVNATAQPITVDIGRERFREVPAYAATAYRAIEGDVFVLTHEGDREVLTPRARAFFSVVYRPGGITVISDDRHTDPARAQLVLYNLTSSPADFVAVEPSATLASSIVPGESANRVVNAIPMRLGASVGGEMLYEAALEPRRGESYTLVVLATKEQSGFVIRASVGSE